MATGLYDKGREGFLDGSIDWDTNTIKSFLAKNDYVENLATHDNLDDIVAGSRVGTHQTLGTKTVTDGVADAADITFPTVAAGSVCEAIILYKDTGVESTSRLIAYIDNYTGLPVTTNGGNITVQWPNDANRIFKL